MNNHLIMSATFEKEKNVKASAYTLGITGGLLLLFFLWKISSPVVPPPVTEEFIEVNLGNSDFGSGKDQPMLPGEPAPAEQTAYTPPQPVHSTESNTKAVETNDRADNDAPAIKTPAVSKPNATKIDATDKVVKSTPNPQPVVQAPPKPKAVLGRTVGGNGNGGNGADSYKPGTGEGIAGGQGDQGRVGGSPNGTAYTGTPKNFGVREFSIPNQSFEDDFDRNAKIAMEIVTNDDGKVVSANYTAKNSSGTATTQMKEIARRRAFQLKVGPNMKGIVVFNFQVRG
jgi:hypothetical protein